MGLRYERTTIKAPLSVGITYQTREHDIRLANFVGIKQHEFSKARGTRGAGANAKFRILGALGEIVVARMLGIDSQARIKSGPDLTADISWNNYEIEVKHGLPMEAKSKLNTERWYVVVQHNDDWLFQTVAVAHGEDILANAEEPPAHWCPREGTQKLNWRIP